MKKTFFKLLVCITTSFACENFFWNPFQRENRHVAGLILARGGSKSITLKNLAKLGGTPILTISLNEILKTKGFTSVWVSTDHSAVYKEALQSNVNINWRSAESAADTTSSVVAIQEFINYHPEIDYVALIQCTSPFIKSKYLQSALSLLNFKKAECVFSVTRSHKLRWAKQNGNIVPLNFNQRNRPRRQDWEGEFIENGMFYFSRTKLIKQGYLQTNRQV